MDDLHAKIVKKVMRERRRGNKTYNPLKLINRLLNSSNVEEEDIIQLILLKISESRMRSDLKSLFEGIDLYLKVKPICPEPWLELLKYYRDDCVNFNYARLVSDIAVNIAKLDGNFVRQSLGEKMRLLIVFNRIEDANKCLSELVRYAPPLRSIDVNWEYDFLSLPAASELDQNLVRKYREFSN